MAIVKYTHAEGEGNFELELEVNHTKSIYIHCPRCKWLSEFRPKDESIYDPTDNFKLNKFKVLDESLFAPVKAVRKTRKTTGSKKTKVLTMKLPKNVKEVNKTVYSFNYKTKMKLKEKNHEND